MLIFLLSMKRLATSLTHSFIHSFIQPVPTERVPDTVLGGHKDLTVITKVSALEALSATATSLTHTHTHTPGLPQSLLDPLQRWALSRGTSPSSALPAPAATCHGESVSPAPGPELLAKRWGWVHASPE